MLPRTHARFSDWRDFGCYPRGILPSVLCVKPKRSHGPFRDTPWSLSVAFSVFETLGVSRLGMRQIMMHPAVDSDLQAEGGGGGGTLQNFGPVTYYLTHLLICLLYRKSTPSV